MRAGGRIEFDHVWLDDRAACCWALADVSFVLEPGDLAAVLDTEGSHGGDAIIDLLVGRRRPVRGSVTIEGQVREFRASATGEHRAVVAGRTMVVADPCTDTLCHADLVIVLDHGAMQGGGTKIDLTDSEVRSAG